MDNKEKATTIIAGTLGNEKSARRNVGYLRMQVELQNMAVHYVQGLPVRELQVPVTN